MRGNSSVNKKRILQLNGKKAVRGPVIYWMSRDQRVSDNWALIFALELAAELETFVIVSFVLTYNYPGANLRHYGFMVQGLAEVERKLAGNSIPFRLLSGNPPERIALLAQEVKAGAIVTDFDPLRIKKEWQSDLAKKIEVALYEVDAHNIVPCRIASDKQEFGAYTIRPKITRQMDEFMVDYPEISAVANMADSTVPLAAGLTGPAGWKVIKKRLLASVSIDVEEVDWLDPGEAAAAEMLNKFMATKLSAYNERRNDPNSEAISDMSPYLHFGQISAQRMALEIVKGLHGEPGARAYLEELVIRRELSDNFCHYNPHYDTFEGFPSWAKTTLNAHRRDEREHLYDREQFENFQTHDELWNAAQTEIRVRGKMHGYMRMYWAKKILEWSASPEEALETAIYLNDKYGLDGRDPNGYTGCAWSIGGLHDRAWGERPVFGKIRFMNAGGCKRKFDTSQYISRFS